jgi:hypothetical protein
VRKILNLPTIVFIVIATAAINISAQNALGQTSTVPQLAATNSAAVITTNSPSSPASQAVIYSLGSLPEADLLVYINPQRILNEAVPKLLPAKDVEGMRKGFEEAKKNSGIDPTKVEYIVLAVRFRKPTADLNFQAPELMAVSGGDFSAESLLTLARMASQGKLRDERYADKTIGLMTIDPIVKESEKNPFLKSFSEVGLVALNGNTIAAGSPSYLRAAVDAGAGQGRINTETLNSLVRDTNVLVSIAGRPWHSFAKSFGMLGTDANAREPRCETNLGDFYAALTMDSTNFMLRGVSNADNPDTAKIIANLYSGILRYATSSVPDESVKSLLRGLSITAEGNEVHTRGDFSQQMVLDLIQQKMKPKTMEPSAPESAPVKPVTRRRRPRRRG